MLADSLIKIPQVLTTTKHRQWLPLLPSRQSCLNNTLIAATMLANGIFSDPVMNFMSCVALTGQVTKTKTKKAEYFEGETIVYMSQKRFQFHDSR